MGSPTRPLSILGATPMRVTKLLTAIAGRLALLLGSVALTLALAEVAFRVLDVLPTHRDSLRGFHEHHESLGWLGTRGYTARFRHDDFDVVIENDARGFRRPAVAFDGPAEAPHWAFLGDSFTWGWGVAQGEVFTDRLQRLAGRRARISNYGVNAYGTGQERLLLEELVLPDRPDVAVVMFFGNDPGDSVYSKKGRRPHYSLEGGALRLHNRPVSRPLVGPFDRAAQHSVVLSILRERMKRFEDRFEVDNQMQSSAQDWEVVTALLAEMKALAAAAEPPCELRVVYIPTACEISVGAKVGAEACAGPLPRDREALAAACAALGIPLLDLTGPLAAAWRASPEPGGHGEPVYFTRDGHWTALGHELAAQEIFSRWEIGGQATGRPGLRRPARARSRSAPGSPASG
jgi:lysophospholipase L1-like esterase